MPLFPLAWKPIVGCVSCLSSYCPWHTRSSTQKYFKKLKVIPFEFQVKSFCCSYNLELNQRNWNTWQRSHRIEIRTWTAFDLYLEAFHPGPSKRKHPCHCPAQPPDLGTAGAPAWQSLSSLVPAIVGSNSIVFAESHQGEDPAPQHSLPTAGWFSGPTSFCRENSHNSLSPSAEWQ